MLTTVIGLLLVLGVIFLVTHVVKPEFPLWATVLILLIMEALRVIPLGK